MKKIGILIVSLFVFAGSGQAAIYTVFSDKGIPPGNQLFTWPPGVILSSTTVPSQGVPEGQYSMYTQSTVFGGWGVFVPGNINLSACVNGEIRFWIFTTNPDLTVSLERPGATGNPAVDCANGTKTCVNLAPLLANSLLQWKFISLPCAGVNLSTVYSPFQITMNTPGQFLVDHVRYVESVGGPIFNVSAKNISDNQPAAQITWSGTPSGGWVRASQYLELELDPYNLQTWGVQIYTDNRRPGANPTFVLPTGVISGAPGSNPAGLVSVQNPSNRIPMAWSIKANPATPPVAADPNNPADTNSFQWLFMKDQQTPNIPAEGTTVFQNGDIDPFVNVKRNMGIHYGQRATDFGAENSPNAIYLEANFGAALAQQTYRTSTLIVEFFSL